MASLGRKLWSLRCCGTNVQRLVSRSVSGRNNIKVINYLYNNEVERHRRSRLSQHPDVSDPEEIEGMEEVEAPRDFRYVQPEFLPSPIPQRRDRITEMLERQDMYRRRAAIELPEFYVGSVMAVTVADKYSSSKLSRFVGICIERGEQGLRSFFLLRNVVDGLGVEIRYELYNPLVMTIEVLKLEKRLDERLMYLRDALPEYSSFPQDMEPVPLPKGSKVPVNPLKVTLKPPPWHERWERQDLKGVQEFEISAKRAKKAKIEDKPWLKYDLMHQYRENINEVEADSIMRKVYLQRLKQEERQNRGKTQGVTKK